MSNCYRSPNRFRLDKVSQTTHFGGHFAVIMELENHGVAKQAHSLGA